MTIRMRCVGALLAACFILAPLGLCKWKVKPTVFADNPNTGWTLPVITSVGVCCEFQVRFYYTGNFDWAVNRYLLCPGDLEPVHSLVAFGSGPMFAPVTMDLVVDCDCTIRLTFDESHPPFPLNVYQTKYSIDAKCGDVVCD